MASEIRVDNITSLSGVGTITPSATGVEIAGITTVSTLKATTGIVTTLTTNTLTANSTAKVGSGVTLSPDGDVFVTGVTTSTTVKVGGGVTISESGIDASGIGITCANINGTQIGGRRNLIINGAMEVAQRGTSSTEQLYQTVDRMRLARAGVDENPTQAQVDVAAGTTPYTLGFRKALKITNGNQTSGAGAADTIGVSYRIEARDIRTSGWDYTNPNSFITIQFWVYSNVGQTYYFRLSTQDGTSQNYTTSYTLSANTWTKIVKTIPGNSNIQFDDDFNQGLRINFSMFAGTTYTSGSMTLNSWAAVDGNNQFPDQTSTWYTTNDATWNITGLQLEVGPQATAFEHRSFAEELQLCKRYFQKSYAYETAPGTTNSPLNQIIGRAYASVQNRMELQTKFEVEMRATPTIITYTPHGGVADKVEDYSSGNGSASGTARDVSAVRNLGNKGFGGITVSPAQDGVLGVHYTADAEM